MRVIASKPNKTATACGNGSTGEFSGAVTLEHFKEGIVEVFYCSGVDVFPAELTVRFTYGGDDLTIRRL